MGIDFGDASWHSPWVVQEAKKSFLVSTLCSTRGERSDWPWGSRLRCEIFAAVNSCAAPFGQAATQAPQLMHAAASNAASATGFGTGVMFASGAAPVLTVM